MASVPLFSSAGFADNRVGAWGGAGARGVVNNRAPSSLGAFREGTHPPAIS